MKDRETAFQERVARLVKTYEPERIYLFGSQVREDAGPDSDIDLLVVVPDTTLPSRKRSALAYESLWEMGEPAEVVVMSHSSFERKRHLKGSLPGTVLREGKLLYAL